MRPIDTAPFVLGDDHLFLGASLTLNDEQDTSALIGGIIDHDTGSTRFNIGAKRRLGDT